MPYVLVIGLLQMQLSPAGKYNNFKIKTIVTSSHDYRGRMIGYSDAACAVTSTYSWFGGLSRPATVWMSDVRCTGLETALDQCNFAGWGNSRCSRYAGIVCANSKLLKCSCNCTLRYSLSHSFTDW